MTSGSGWAGRDSGAARYPHVMSALVAAIHLFVRWGKKDVDGRDKPGHDASEVVMKSKRLLSRL